MAGESAGRGSGESKWQSGEYARGILQRTGKKALGALEEELQTMPRAELMQHFGIEPTTGLYYEIEGGLRSGMGTDEAYREIFGDRYQPETKGDGEEGPKPEDENNLDAEAEKAIEKVLKASEDRYGNSISTESLQNLRKLAIEDPEKFAAEMLEWNRNQQREAAEKGYLNAQKEIASLLEGRSPEEFLEVYAHDINKFRRDIKNEEKKIVAIDRTNQLEQYKTDEAREFKEKQLLEMRGLLREMERKYALIANLQKGSDDAVPVPPDSVDEILEIPEDEEYKQPNDLRLELLDANDSTYEVKAKVRRHDIEMAAKYMPAREAERLLQQLANTEVLEKELKRRAQGDFAEPPKGGGSDEDIKRDAEEAGGSSSQRNNQKAQKERDRDYRKAMSDWARESKPGRFNDPELPLEEKERLVGKIFGAIKNRVPFKRKAYRAMMGVLALLMASGVLVGAFSRDGSNRVYAASGSVTTEDAGAENPGTGDIVKNLEDSGVAGDSAAELAESLGMSAEDLYGGEINYTHDQALAEASKILDNGFAEMEGTTIMQNGVMGNSLRWESPDKHSKNSFGPSAEYLYDIEDPEERKQATIDETIAVVRDQPQALASMAAACPEFLRLAGVSEDIINIQGLEARANAVLDLMLNTENGGELQRLLLGGVSIALQNENTDFHFYLEYGTELTFYQSQKDSNKPNTPDNFNLKLDKKKRDGAKQVQITFIFAGGIKNVTDKNLECDEQENVDEETGEIRITITDEPDDTFTRQDSFVEMPDITLFEESDLDSTVPDGEQPEGEETPDGEGDEEQPEGEQIKQKDAENEKRIVEQSGKSNPVDQAGNVDELAKQGIVDASNGNAENAIAQEDITGDLTGTYEQTAEAVTPVEQTAEIVDTQQADANASAEQQVADQEAQAAANDAENLNSMSEAELSEYVDSLLQ